MPRRRAIFPFALPYTRFGRHRAGGGEAGAAEFEVVRRLCEIDTTLAEDQELFGGIVPFTVQINQPLDFRLLICRTVLQDTRGVGFFLEWQEALDISCAGVRYNPRALGTPQSSAYDLFHTFEGSESLFCGAGGRFTPVDLNLLGAPPGMLPPFSPPSLAVTLESTLEENLRPYAADLDLAEMAIFDELEAIGCNIGEWVEGEEEDLDDEF